MNGLMIKMMQVNKEKFLHLIFFDFLSKKYFIFALFKIKTT